MAIRTKLRKHQEQVVEFCATNGYPYAGIFSDYGTGKTLIALVLAHVLKFKRIFVVSTTLAIDTTWCDEIRKHTDYRYCVLRGTRKQKANLLEYALGQTNQPDRYGAHAKSDRPMIFLLNYEGVKGIYWELRAAKFDVMITDESTKIKSFNSERTKAAYAVSENIPHRYIMTGFPVTEHFSELYSQIKFLDRGKVFGTSYYAFMNRFFTRAGPKNVIKRKSIKEIVDLIKPFCIRLTNEMLKLPPKQYKEITLELTDQQKQLLKTLNETFRLEFGKVNIDTQYIFTLISKSLQICDGFVQNIVKEKETGTVISSHLEIIETNKDEALLEVLEQIDVAQNKVVIWCAFLFSVRKIAKILSTAGLKVLTLTGETIDANKTVQWFQKSRDHNVLICTVHKAAESVTLTSAKYSIYYSNVWSYDKRANSEARIRRMGSEKHSSITYIDLITKSSVEKRVYDCLRKKKDLVNELKQAFLAMKGEVE